MTTPLALAYSSEDQAIAYAIEQDLKGAIRCQHVSVDDSNGGPTLVDLLQEQNANGGSILLLVSKDFINNPNAMMEGLRLLQMGKQLMPVMIEGHEAGSDAAVALVDRQVDIMRYVGQWQTRYLDLRRQSKSLSEEAGSDFDQYYRKIREIAGQVNDFLHQLKDDVWRRSLAELRIDHYRQLFIWLDMEDSWAAFSSRSVANAAHELPKVVPPPAETPKEEPVPGPAPVDPTTEEPLKEEATTLPENQPSKAAEPATPAAGSAAPTTNQEDGLEWIQRAWEMAQRGELQAALTLLQTGRERMPDLRELRYHLALMQAAEADNQQAARRELDALLADSPDYEDALFLSGELYELNDDYESALEHWTQLAEQNADYPDLAGRIGDLLFTYFPDRQYDAAGFLRQAIKQDPEAIDARFHYALLCIHTLDQPAKAMKHLRKVVDRDPRHAAAHFQLAELLRQDGQLELARASYIRARELDGSYASDANEAAFEQAALEAALKQEQVQDQQADVLRDMQSELESLHAALKEDQDNLDQLSREIADLIDAQRSGTGQIALISGASSGIGRATALRLAAAGYQLILTGRRQQRLEALKSEIADSYETDCQLLTFDICERDAAQSALDSLPKEWQEIDLLINNAGKAKGLAPIHEGQLDHWDEMIDTNLRGLLYLTRAVVPAMVARGQGMIINVCSTAGKEVYPNGNVYNATKSAVNALTHAMRLDLVSHNIRVGQICPAHVEETEFALVRFDGDEDKARIYQDFQPLTSHDVAEAIYFMVSQPQHVNILDMVIQGSQQASSTVIHRSGRSS